MKPKYILTLLAAAALLPLSLNAQKLPAKKHAASKPQVAQNQNVNERQRGAWQLMANTENAAQTGRSPFRAAVRPPLKANLNAGEYLFGPYTTDDFDATGVGYASLYDQAQQIIVGVDLERSEWESHLGEEIVGFRFALAGSNDVNVYSFGLYPASDKYWAGSQNIEWKLGELNGGSGSGTDQYVKVTSASDLTSGEYLIVYETGGVAFNGGLATLDAGNNVISVSISNNTIEANATTNAANFTIDVSAGTIKSASGYYIGNTANSNSLSSSTTTAYTNTISLGDNGNAVIQCSASTARFLRFNSATGDNNYRFRYYQASSQQDIYLYKRVTTNGSNGSSSNTDYTLLSDAINSANFTTGTINTSAPWTATNVYNQSSGALYFAANGSLLFTVPEGYNNANFKFVFKTSTSYYAGTFTFTPSVGSAKTVTTSAASTEYECELTGLSAGNTVTITGVYGSYSYSPDFIYMNVYSQGGSSAIAEYMTLTPGQWHDFYLDEPVPFTVSGDTITSVVMGYTYDQLYNTAFTPVAYNSNSTGHGHWALMYAPTFDDLVITIPGNTMNFSSITVYDSSNNVLTSWNSSSTNVGTVDNSDGGTSTYYILPDGWTLGNSYMFRYGTDSYTGYVSTSSTETLTISSSALGNNRNVTVVIAAYDDNGSVTMSVNGSGKTISTSTSGSYTWSVDRINYQQGWWGLGTSGSSNTFMPGDLAVQLIFKSQMEKTATPVITTSTTADGVTITATGDGEVTLTVNGQTVTGTGSASITLGRGSEDYTVTATATAIEDGKRESDPATQTVTIPATELDPTPAPVISTTQYDLNVLVGGTGTGTVHFYIDGVEVDSPYYLERKSTSYTVTVTVTAQEEGKAMATTTQTVTVPARGTVDLSGWTLLDSGLGDEDAIDMGDGLNIIDRFSVSVANNGHPSSYTYRLVEDRDASVARASNTMTVPVQHTGSVVNGYYTAADVAADLDRHLRLDLMNADVEMNLANNPAIYYYTLERGINDMPELETTRLQRTLNGTYHEMDTWYSDGIDEFDYGIIHRFDTIGQVPYRTGVYGGENFMTYVPVVWTLGNATGNVRANWNNDHKHNSYGSPIWKTGVGKVDNENVEVTRQTGRWATWTDADGNKCSLYRAHVTAHGYLPKPMTADNATGTNVDYEPFMYRIWVACDSLRGYVKDDGEDGTGALMPDPDFTPTDMMWLADVPVDPSAIVTPGYYNVLDYGDVSDKNEGFENDLVFGATSGEERMTFIIRFYYRSKLGTIVESPTLRATGDDGARYYAAEGSESPDRIPTAVNEIMSDYHGNVVGVTYFDTLGRRSSRPFDGVNIVVTRYSDGTTRSTKVLY